MQFFTLPFSEKHQLTEDTYTFFFEKPTNYPSFLAGQYGNFILEHPNPDDRGIRRYFTFSSSPLDERISITTRVMQSTFKKALLALFPGQTIQVSEPLGKFVLPEDLSPHFVFLAGGIGITPFHSILHYIDQTKTPIIATLFVSFSEKKEVIWKEEFEQIVQNNQGIQSIYTLTHEENTEWDGERGRITKEMIGKYVPDPSSASFYICGPRSMVSAFEEMLLEQGIQPERIKKENLIGY